MSDEPNPPAVGGRLRRVRRSIEVEVARFVLPPLFRRNCPFSIPYGGPEARTLDCFSIHADRFGAPWLFVRSAGHHGVRAHLWDGRRYDTSRFVAHSWSEIPLGELRVNHHLRGGQISFRGIWDLVLGRLFRWSYLKLRCIQLLDRAGDRISAARGMPVPRRLEVLRAIRSHQSKRARGPGWGVYPGFSSLELMEDLYGPRWIAHPDYQQTLNDLELVLRGLLESGDVERADGINYKPRGQMVATLEELEIEATRDKSLATHRWALLALGVVALPGFLRWAVPTVRDQVFPWAAELARAAAEWLVE